MSAPQQGRQSPEPERQSGSQVGKQANPNDQGAAPSQDYAKDKSEQQKTDGGLPSNPASSGYGKAAEEKTSKD